MLNHTINLVLILKSIRSWFFSIFLILFSTIIFYIVIEVYLKYFLDSLKIVKERLKVIIKKNDIQIEENSSLTNSYIFNEMPQNFKSENNLFKVPYNFYDLLSFYYQQSFH